MGLAETLADLEGAAGEVDGRVDGGARGFQPAFSMTCAGSRSEKSICQSAKGVPEHDGDRAPVVAAFHRLDVAGSRRCWPRSSGP